MRNYLNTTREFDAGNVLENVVFLNLIKKSSEVYFFKGTHECDFVYFDRSSRRYAVVQVTYELNEENRDRELAGLVEPMDYFKVRWKWLLLK